jgi:hypothetical protein
MAIIVDADVIIRGEKGRFDFRNWLASRPNETFEIAACAYGARLSQVKRIEPLSA